MLPTAFAGQIGVCKRLSCLRLIPNIGCLALFAQQPSTASSNTDILNCPVQLRGSTTSSMTFKSVEKVLPTRGSHWVGDGFHVLPVFADFAFTNKISPFLMFDYGAPKRFEPTSRKLGVGQHPHRGFETVTIAFQGEVEHGDSVGNRGVIGPGDVQWMTAARGIVHEEFHSRNFASEGGILEMAQLWVNLPAKDKMVAPRYQSILSKDIPRVEIDGGAAVARVIAGSLLGTPGAAKTFSPIDVWDIEFKEAKQYEFPVRENDTMMLFVRRGAITACGNTAVDQGRVVLLSQAGDRFLIETLQPDTAVLFLGGQPLNEPIAARGPFVMNTQEELQQAIIDYKAGHMGD